MRARKRVTWLAGLLIAGASLASAAEPAHEWKNVERIVAVGDVHGDYENFVAILQNAGLIDEHLRWTGGQTHLVQNGDILDRGPDSRKCMDLLMKLEGPAQEAGGRIHVLIGNHEAMNVVGILDYVSPEEFQSFADKDSETRRDMSFELFYENLRRESREKGEEVPSKTEARSQFEEQYPLGYIEHRSAFGPQGRYGRWIREHNVAVKINDIVFSHGDWSEEMSALGIEEINRRVRAELKGEVPLEAGVTFQSESPLQYRGLAHVPLDRVSQEAATERVDRILANLGAKRMVVGHTTTEGWIEPRFGRKHISIDVGILRLYRTGGNQIALEVVGEELHAVHPKGKVTLPEFLDPTTEIDYLRAIAEVDPENLIVHQKLADHYLKVGDLASARVYLERYIAIPKRGILVHYHRELADVYRALGQPEKARQGELTFIHALAKAARSMPNNPNLINVLARFCVDRNLELELAERLLRDGLSGDPDNKVLAVTYGRLEIRRERYQEAAARLERVVADGGPDYEALYYLGRAYLGLQERAKALEAFQRAHQVAPDREEAKQEIQRLGGQPGGQPSEAREPAAVPP